MASLYTSMSAEEAQELPDGFVGTLIDYAIDDDVVMEFKRSKEQAEMRWRRRLAPCCRPKEEPRVAPSVAERSNRPQFAAEIESLAESVGALDYRVERAKEEEESAPRWKKCYRAARGFVSGRYYKVRGPA
jgi:hypothetical protein